MRDMFKLHEQIEGSIKRTLPDINATLEALELLAAKDTSAVVLMHEHLLLDTSTNRLDIALRINNCSHTLRTYYSTGSKPFFIWYT